MSLDEPGGPLESQWERPVPLAGLVAIRLAKDRSLRFDLGGTDEVSQNTSDRSGYSVARSSLTAWILPSSRSIVRTCESAIEARLPMCRRNVRMRPRLRRRQ